MAEEYDYQIIANLMAGKGEAKRKLESLKKFLDKNGKTYRSLEIEKPIPISKLPTDGKIAIQKGVICLGGDGTISETVGYVINHKIDVPIVIIPTGTANIVSSTLGVPSTNDFEHILKEHVKEIDIGVAEYGIEKNYIILGLGLGFEENFLKITKEKLKSRLGIFSYLIAAFVELLSLKSIPVIIKTGGKELNKNICLLNVLNLKPKVFNFFPMFHKTEIVGNDGKLNLFYVEYKNFFQVFLGTLVFHVLGESKFGLTKEIVASEFEISSSQIVGTQVDGELRGNLPVKISLLPKTCKFLV